MKTFIKKTLCFLKHVIQLANNIYRNNSVTQIKYISLAPINDVKDCEEHINALQWALSNSRIKNIALTGPFGSGKSSIIQTFLERNPIIKDKSIQVSLATFSEEELDLEEGILKQLFYKVKPSDIPQSRYRKIHRISYRRIFGITFLGSIFAGIIAFIFTPSILESCYKHIIEAGNKLNMPTWVSFSIFTTLILGILCALTKVIQISVYRFSIKDVKLPKDSFTLSVEPQEKEILNKKIDEIVYFFEETQFRVVFFEDLDRFNDPTIFVKLRELNTLLNNYDAIKETVVFVYAIKDEMFTGAERTKFFDFILPVIPVINSTNSGEIFLKLLNIKNGVSQEHDITQEYISDVSPFISDMRVLHNIHNEFLLYKKTIKSNQGLNTLDDKIILSLIIFKNLYPDQFSLLQNEDGIVKQAFLDKDIFVKKRKDVIQKEIDTYIQTLNNIDTDILNSEQELKYIMLCAITDWKGITYSITRNGDSTISAQSILKSDFNVKELVKQGQWTVRYSEPNGRTSSLIYNDFPEKCAPYLKRLEYLKFSSEENILQTKKSIEQLETDAQMLSSLSLQELLDKYEATAVFSSKNTTVDNGTCSDTANPVTYEVQSNNLLVFMLRKGYINEEYANYINFFKGNSITVSDMNFIMSIKTQTPKDFSYSLSPSKLPQIMAKLQLHEFDEKAILNFDLLEHMLSYHDYDDKLMRIIKQLTKDEKINWKFIDQFIDKTNQQKRFIKMIFEVQPKIWDYIYDNPYFTDDRKIYLLQLLCFYLNIEDICTLNKSGLLSKFFVDNDTMLQKTPSNLIEKTKKIISTLNISFVKLNIYDTPKILLDFVFDNCYYELTPDMIHSIVEYKDVSLCNLINTQNYTTITQLGYQPLLDYVHNNLDLYIDSIFLLDDNTQEAIQSIVTIIEKSIANPEQCGKIISHSDFVLNNITDICNHQHEENESNVQNIWDMLLNYNRLNVTWKNIYDYWRYYELTTTLCNYIEKHVDVLAKLDSSCLDDIFKENIILSEINNLTFKKIASKIRMKNFNIGLKKFSVEKLSIMVRNKYFPFTVATYTELNEYAPELCGQFILLNQKDYQKIFEKITLTNMVFEELILNNTLSRSSKEKFLDIYGEELMTKEVANYLCSGKVSINHAVFTSAWKIIDNSIKQKDLLMHNLNVLELEDFEKYLVMLDSPYNKLNRTPFKHEEIIPDNKDNRALVDRLKAIKYLTSSKFETQNTSNSKHSHSVIRCRVKAKTSSPKQEI